MRNAYPGAGASYHRLRGLRVALPLGLLLVAACNGDVTPYGGGAGSGDGGGPGAGGAASDGGGQASSGADGGRSCGAERVRADVVPPNLLIALDRSCSMRRRVGTRSKWQIAIDAITQLAGSFKGRIRFGLSLFPDREPGKCTQGAVTIPVAAGKESAITALLKRATSRTDRLYPNGPCITNIDTAMKQAADHKPLRDTTRESYVLLITDGAQYGCSAAGGDKGTTKLITDLYQKRKVATFVVGFGGAVDAKQLEIFAAAGGRPASGATKYYKAEDQASLTKALKVIGTNAFGCVMTLKKVPAKLSDLWVLFDKKPIKRDTAHSDGWDYDRSKNRLTFYGASCKSLKNDKVKTVDILFSCGSEPPTPGGGPASCPAGSQSCSSSGDCGDQATCVSGCCAKVIQ